MAIWVKPNGNEIEINDQDGNVKAAVSMGWKLKSNTDDSDDLKNDPEKGNGNPGTANWHKTAVKGMSDTGEIQEYMRDIGIDMNATGNLRAAKKAACKLIDEARPND